MISIFLTIEVNAVDIIRDLPHIKYLQISESSEN